MAKVKRLRRPRVSDLTGRWEYLRWEIVYPDGTTTHPFGADACGTLLYTADGGMSANIMAGARPALSKANPRAASMAERARAFDGYFGYAGRWRLEGERVAHEVTVASNPALVGSVQWRTATFRGRSLTLSVEEPVAGGLRVHRLVWQRPRRARSAQRSKAP
ncbi:MAG: lipocalin-like domain-containing protein [Sinobacteraceae bacterium]|nr:lipocalin-like domain-containing protein [Nevskiaceae bacterium]